MAVFVGRGASVTQAMKQASFGAQVMSSAMFGVDNATMTPAESEALHSHSNRS